ncbi:MAG: type 4a pilus biogenesis protein PilO [Pseudomonadota bacterium]
MDLQELREIDLQNIGRAPLAVRIGIIVLLMAGTVFAGYQLDIKDMIAQRDAEQAKEPDLKRQVEEKQRLAANLEAYREQLTEMEHTFGTLLRQLPNKKEVENLIVDVTQTALANGLKDRQIKPGQEIVHDFYAEIPYTLHLEGDFHQLAKFASDASALPRIVTLHDFVTITPSKDFARDKQLSLQIMAKTYRYLEESEISKPAAPSKGKSPAAGKG